jgi:hypothetical protein
MVNDGSNLDSFFFNHCSSRATRLLLENNLTNFHFGNGKFWEIFVVNDEEFQLWNDENFMAVFSEEQNFTETEWESFSATREKWGKLWEGRRAFSPLWGIFVDGRTSSCWGTLGTFRSTLKLKNNSTFIHDTRGNLNILKDLNHMETRKARRMSENLLRENQFKLRGYFYDQEKLITMI